MKKLQQEAALIEKHERNEAEKVRLVEFAWLFTRAYSDYERSPEDYYGDKIYVISARWLNSLQSYIKYNKIRKEARSEQDLHKILF